MATRDFRLHFCQVVVLKLLHPVVLETNFGKLTSANYQNLSFRRYLLTIEVQVEVYDAIVFRSCDLLHGCQIRNFSSIVPGFGSSKNVFAFGQFCCISSAIVLTNYNCVGFDH